MTLYQLKHELWLKILFSSFAIKDEKIKSELYEFANMQFRHLKWLSNELEENKKEYSYKKGEISIQKESNFKYFQYLIDEIQVCIGNYEESVLCARIISDEFYMIQRLELLLSDEKNDGEIEGFLASFVQQVSFDPLRISLAIKPERVTYEQIIEGGSFTLNIVSKEKSHIMKEFWDGYDKNPFLKLKYQMREDAVILEDAHSSIVCKMDSKHCVGDHDLVVADVLNSYINHPDDQVLVHLRNHGDDY